MIKPIQNTACHLVFGFLGSGKSSLINACIDARGAQNWAVLVNEIGQIGIDEQLFKDKVAVRQISGGCICCTSQLPLQIAIVRLLSDYHPSRLWIEPTGLAHPKALLDELALPHWQAALSIKSVIGVVNALQWQQPRYRNHDHYIAHVRHADIIVVNRVCAIVNSDEFFAWLHKHNPNAIIINQEDDNWIEILMAYWHKPTRQLADIPNAINLTTTAVPANKDTNDGVDVLPYRYHSAQAGVSVMGWRLPADWQVDIDKLTDWLLSVVGWQRMKAVVQTMDGWVLLNFTPDSLSSQSSGISTDNRLELIFDQVYKDDIIAQLDGQLMALFKQRFA